MASPTSKRRLKKKGPNEVAAIAEATDGQPERTPAIIFHIPCVTAATREDLGDQAILAMTAVTFQKTQAGTLLVSRPSVF